MSRAVELQAVTVEEEGRAVTYERPDIDEPDIPCIRCSGQASARWLLYADPPPTSCMGTGCPVCGPCVKLGETGARHMPLLRSARHVAVVLAGIHGSLDVTALALLADKDSLEPLLDHAEREWLTRDGWRLPVVDIDWPLWDAHGDPDGNNPHVWHACERRVLTGATFRMTTAYGDTAAYGDTESMVRVRSETGRPVTAAGVTTTSTTWTSAPDHRCTCGLYKSDWERECADAVYAGMRDANRRLMQSALRDVVARYVGDAIRGLGAATTTRILDEALQAAEYDLRAFEVPAETARGIFVELATGHAMMRIGALRMWNDETMSLLRRRHDDTIRRVGEIRHGTADDRVDAIAYAMSHLWPRQPGP